MPVLRLKIKEVLARYRDNYPSGKVPTQVEIAVYAGVNPATLSHYVTGKVQRPDLELLGRLCAYIGVKDMNEIFELVEDDEA